MADISMFTSIGMILTTVLVLWFFYKASGNWKLILGIVLWMLIVAILGITGFYQDTESKPPRFFFLLGPVVIFVGLSFATEAGRSFAKGLDEKWLTLLHAIRIPVEILLYYVYVDGLIPELMTYSGYNFDILSGLTAPIVYYLVFHKNRGRKNLLLVWNVLCLVLLLIILTIAVLSAQTPIQMLAFDQPNVGVTYFPFVWLPAVIVPIVLYSHLTMIGRLVRFGDK